MKTILVSLSLLSLVACSTPMIDRFSKIELGMDKTDVLDELGSPNRTFRQDQQDIWIYSFQTDNSVEQREVSFKNEFVSYVGEPHVRNEAPKKKSEGEAAAVLEKEIKKKNKPSPKVNDYKDVKEDGSF